MAWYNPKTWFAKPTETKTTTIEPEKTAVRSIDIVTTDKAGTPTGGGYVNVKGEGAWTTGSGGGGAGGYTPAREVVQDASYSADATASGSAEIGEEKIPIEQPAPNLSKVQGTLPTPIQAGETSTGGGLFFLTSGEARTYKGTQPTWEVQSKNTYEGMVNVVDTESKYAGSVPIITYGSGFKSSQGDEMAKSIYEYNKANIDIAKQGYNIEVGLKNAIKDTRKQFEENPEAFEGKQGFIKDVTIKDTGEEVIITTSYSLSADYFKTLPEYKSAIAYQNLFTDTGTIKSEEYMNYLKSARTDWNKLPKDVRVSSTIAGLQLGVIKGGVGIAEGIIDYGTQLSVKTLKKDETGKFVEPKEFSFGTRAMTIPSEFKTTSFLKNPAKWGKELITERPTAFGTGAVYTGLITPAITNVGKNIYYGYKAGQLGASVTKTFSYLSPVRLTGTYVPNVKEEFIRGFKKSPAGSLEFTSDGETFTYTEGVTKDFKIGLKSSQLATSTGKGATGVSLTEVSNVPYLTFERTGIGEFGTFTPQYYATDLTAVPYGTSGFRATTYTQNIATGEGKITRISGFRPNLFSGTNYDIYGFVGGERTTTILSADTSKFIQSGFEPTIRGYGLSFNLQPEATGDKGFTIIKGGGTKTPFSKTFGSDVTQVTTQQFKTPAIIGFSQLPKTSFLTGSGITSGLSGGLLTTTRTNVREKEKIKTTTLTTQALNTRQLTKSFTTTIQKPVEILKTPSAQAISPAQSQKQAQTEVFAHLQTYAGAVTTPPVTTTYGLPEPYVPFIPPFKLPKLFGGLGNLGTKTYKGKSRYKYTPSYEALTGFAKGKTTKRKGFTGLEVRGIPKGFTWAYKSPKLNLNFLGFNKKRKKSTKRRKK